MSQPSKQYRIFQGYEYTSDGKLFQRTNPAPTIPKENVNIPISSSGKIRTPDIPKNKSNIPIPPSSTQALTKIPILTPLRPNKSDIPIPTPSSSTHPENHRQQNQHHNEEDEHTIKAEQRSMVELRYERSPSPQLGSLKDEKDLDTKYEPIFPDMRSFDEKRGMIVGLLGVDSEDESDGDEEGVFCGGVED